MSRKIANQNINKLFKFTTLPSKKQAPFGMEMGGREFSQYSKYRFGFNGQESQNEISGEGKNLDFNSRVYNSQLARLLSIDPLATDLPFQSTYQFAANNPIYYIDENGEVAGPATRERTGADYSNIKVQRKSYDNLNWFQTKVDVFGYNTLANIWNSAIGASEMATNSFTSQGRNENTKTLIIEPLMWLTKTNTEKKNDVLDGLSDIRTYESVAGALLLHKLGINSSISVESGRAAALSKVYAENIIKSIPKSRLPRAVSAIVDTKTGEVYFGRSGGLKQNAPINPELRRLFPKVNSEEFPVMNCAECDALNNALNGGAKLENLEMHTLKIDKKTGTFTEFERCDNCKETTKDIKTTSDK